MRIGRASNAVKAFALFVTLAAFAGVSSAQEVCAGANKITALGGRQTMFHGPLGSQQDLQSMFAQRESEIRTLLAQSGFQGNPDDLFAAVRAGEGVSRTSVAPGRRMGWMFFRRRDQPIVKMDACWAGKAAFEGYQITFTSDGTEYTMVAPDECGNLALLDQRAARVVAQPPRPTCQLQVSHRCENFTIDASGSTAQTLSLSVQTPSGTTDLGAPDSSKRWTFEGPDREGTYTFSLSGSSTAANQTVPCSVQDSVTLDVGAPSMGVTASATDVRVREEVVVTGSPRVDSCAEISAVALDAQAVTAPYQAPFSWTKPGTYTVEGVVTDDLGQTARGEVTINVTRAPSSWTIRPFVGKMDVDDEVRQGFYNNDIRRNWLLDGGEAVGVQAEYLFRPWVGFNFGVMFQKHELHFMWDSPTEWLMDDDDLDGFTLFAGPLFHLTPDRRVDFFLGPMVAYTDWGGADQDLGVVPAPYGSVTFDRVVPADFDSELHFGLQAGLDIPFRADGKWGLYVGLMYFDLDAEADDDPAFGLPDAFTLGVDPLSLNIGLSYDF